MRLVTIATGIVACLLGGVSQDGGCRKLDDPVTYTSIPYDSPGLRTDVVLLGIDATAERTKMRILLPFACGDTNPLSKGHVSFDVSHRNYESVDRGATW